MYSDCTPDYLKMTALNIPAALVVGCMPPFHTSTSLPAHAVYCYYAERALHHTGSGCIELV